MANPDIPRYGGVDYVNDVNNWRAEDIQFLEGRSVLRYPSESALVADGNHNDVGAVAYVADDSNSDDIIEPGSDPRVMVRLRGSGALGTWSRIMSSDNLRIPLNLDNSTSVSLRHASASQGISLRSNGTVGVDSSLQVGSRTTLSNGQISLVTGSVTANIQVSGSNLSSSIPITAPALSTVGPIVGGTGPHMFGGSVQLTSGTLTAPAVTVSGAINAGSGSISGGLNVNAVVAGSVTTTGSNHLHVGNGRVYSNNDSYSEYGTNYVRTQSPQLQHRKLSTQNWVNTAGVVVSNQDPNDSPPGTYPDGTLWIQYGV